MINIAIDGPSGAGKSTLARKVATHFGFIYVDTGALYRTIGYSMLQKGINLKDAERITAELSTIQLNLTYVDGEQCVLLNSMNVSREIRMPEISMAASDVSAIPQVRAYLFDLQKDIANRCNVVMDGRDIGTVVLPQAQVKIFLTATPEDRANRRYVELKQKGIAVDYEAVLSDIKQRDHNDMNREIAPLKQADDAILVDTTGFEQEKSLELLISVITRRLQQEKLI